MKLTFDIRIQILVRARFEFMMFYNSIIIIIMIAFLSTVFATFPDDEEPSLREMKFKAFRLTSSGEPGCSMESPSSVLNHFGSRIECTLRCQEDGRCTGVNWREPSTCEMYSFDPLVFEMTTGCTYFGPGEKLNFNYKTFFPTLEYIENHTENISEIVSIGIEKFHFTVLKNQIVLLTSDYINVQ